MNTVEFEQKPQIHKEKGIVRINVDYCTECGLSIGMILRE